MRELTATSDHKIENHRKSIGILLQYLWKNNPNSLKIRVIMSLLFLISAKLISVYIPFIYRDIVNYLEKSPTTSDQNMAIGLIISYGLAKIIQTVFGELRDFIFIRVSQHARRTIALKTFKHLHTLSLSFHLDRQTGGLSRVIERGTSGIQFILSFMLFNIAPTLLELTFISSLLFYYFGYLYSLIIFLTVFFYIILTLTITEWRLKYRRDMNQKDEQANTKAIDSLLNYETVKYFNNEDLETKRFNLGLEGYEKSAVNSQYSLAILNICQAGVIGIGSICILCLAYQGVVEKKLNIGEFVMINTYMIQLFLPLNFLGFVYRQMKQSLIDMDRMFDINEKIPEIRDDKNSISLNRVKGAIDFSHVTFNYPTSQRHIIKEFSLNISPGKTIAIVGESGSGKSTLVRLLYRFYDVTKGAISIDGVNVQNITLKSLRQHIGIVPQDTVLFNDTIEYNIKYGNPNASDEEFKYAIEAAQLKSFIDKSTNGLKTIVGERGLKVSGGEKQRIAIARTILKNPPILILDEATSALDTKTEKEIESSLQKLTVNRTTIIIAHRLSTIVNSDLIVVMNHGKIIEQGNHTELLNSKKEYYHMWNRQKEIEDIKSKLNKFL